MIDHWGIFLNWDSCWSFDFGLTCFGHGDGVEALSPEKGFKMILL